MLAIVSITVIESFKINFISSVLDIHITNLPFLHLYLVIIRRYFCGIYAS